MEPPGVVQEVAHPRIPSSYREQACTCYEPGAAGGSAKNRQARTLSSFICIHLLICKEGWSSNSTQRVRLLQGLNNSKMMDDQC